MQAFVLADAQAEGRGDHHQYAGGEDADGCQACAVAFHAVGHGGNGNEMVQLIVILFVFLEHLAQRHRAADEQQIGTDDD